MDLWIILGDIVMLLAASLLAGGLFSRFKQSPLIGYLFAGMLLGGPGSLHLVRSEHEIEAIAELGVALLLFSLGLEFSLNRLRQLGIKPLVGGVCQVVTTVLLGAMAAQALGLRTKEAIAFGVMISLSSTAVVLRMLMERSELEAPHGRNSLVVLLTQDMAVVPLALIMTVLGDASESAGVAAQMVRLTGLTAALIFTLYLLNAIAVRTLGTLTLLRNRELTVIFAVVTGLGSACGAHAAGISPALGAFIAGMFLGSSAFATQIRADISSLRVLLLTLFFSAVGMIANPVWIVENWGLVLGVTLMITALKAVIIGIIFLALGQTLRAATATALCLAQIGEFAFVLGTIGRANGAVSTDIYSLVISSTILSFMLSAILVPLAPHLGNIAARLSRKKTDLDRSDRDHQCPPEIVIIGFGPAGRLAAEPFVDKGLRVVVIDLNKQGVRAARALGFEAHVGDATQHDIMEEAQIAEAKTVVITVPHHSAAMTILTHLRQHAPHSNVLVRSRHQLHTEEFWMAGASVVVGDEEQVGESLARHLHDWLTTSHDEAA